MSYDRQFLIAIDLGTSTLKLAIFDTEGKIIYQKSQEYPLLYQGRDIVENDVEKYWGAIAGLIKESLNYIDKPERIIALSISSQGETIVPVDKYINPLRNAIVWLDSRSTKEAEELARVFNEDVLFNITGLPSSDPSWPASRIKWIKDNEPHIFKSTYKFLLLKDYIAYKLTGKIFGESTVYNSTYYYDIKNLCYYKPMLDYLGIKENMLPPICYTGEVIGTISKEASATTGLSTSTKYVIGAMDQVAGAVGAGNISQGIATETTGTAFAMIVTTDMPIIDKEGKIPCQLHAAKGKYCLMPYSNTGGMVLKWFKDSFIEDKDMPDNDIYNLLTQEASKVAPGSDGLIMLPHISGAFFPENNPNARGVFFGISINHRRGHFVRAILESIAFMLRKDLEILNTNNIAINNIISMGGGAKSELWNQIKADVTGVEVKIPKNTETALLGAAIIAGVGVGLYKDFEEAVEITVKMNRVFRPNISNRDIYKKDYDKYIEMYRIIKGVFD